MTWCSNYQNIGNKLGVSLTSNPDQVASNEKLGWATAFKFWELQVHDAAGVGVGQFGSSTNAINGPLECKGGGGRALAEARFAKYSVALQEFGVNETPNPAGCY